MDIETLECRITDLISNNIQLTSIPYFYGDDKDSKEIDWESVERASKEIVEFLKREKLI